MICRGYGGDETIAEGTTAWLGDLSDGWQDPPAWNWRKVNLTRRDDLAAQCTANQPSPYGLTQVGFPVPPQARALPRVTFVSTRRSFEHLLSCLCIYTRIIHHSSAEQAMIACFDWTFKGVNHVFAIDPYDLTKGSRTVFARRCKEEVKTKQWLEPRGNTHKCRGVAWV